MRIEKKALIYSGKAKSLYETNEPDLLITEFRNDMTAFNGVKHEILDNKGKVNALISVAIMERLATAGIPTHLECVLSPTEILVRRLKMIPLECVVRNIAAGSLCKRVNIQAGTKLDPPLFELFVKDDALGDPFITEEDALKSGYATESQLSEMKELTLQINDILRVYFKECDLIFVDAKFEFGVASDGRIYLGDEISPDSCRIWDAVNKEILDKDRFRKDMGGVVSSYQKIAKRLGLMVSESN